MKDGMKKVVKVLRDPCFIVVVDLVLVVLASILLAARFFGI